MTRVRLEEITVRFGDRIVLDNINLNVQHGETLAVLGPSGCGKTTLLKTVAGLNVPQTGRIYFDDRDVTELPPRERAVGMVFETFALYPHLDSRGNLAFPLELRQQQNIEEKINVTANRLGLDRVLLLHRRPGQLSVGEQQKVALGRALIANPSVLLLDEPMSTLDAQTRTRTRAQLGRLIDVFAITSLYVTHDQREAIALADRIAVMNQGNIVQIGTAGEVRRRPANVFVAQFIGSPAMNILTGLFKKERLWFEGVTGGIDLPFTQQPLADGPILVGIRPENLLADPTGVLSMEVIQIERLLAQRAQLVYGEMAGQPLIAQVPAEVQAKPGLTLNLTVAVEDIHLFKYHDETRIW